MLLREIRSAVDRWEALEASLFRDAGAASLDPAGEAAERVVLAAVARRAGERAARWAAFRPTVPPAEEGDGGHDGHGAEGVVDEGVVDGASDRPGGGSAASALAVLERLAAEYADARRAAVPASDGPLLALLTAMTAEVDADRRRFTGGAVPAGE